MCETTQNPETTRGAQHFVDVSFFSGDSVGSAVFEDLTSTLYGVCAHFSPAAFSALLAERVIPESPEVRAYFESDLTRLLDAVIAQFASARPAFTSHLIEDSPGVIEDAMSKQITEAFFSFHFCKRCVRCRHPERGEVCLGRCKFFFGCKPSAATVQRQLVVDACGHFVTLRLLPFVLKSGFFTPYRASPVVFPSGAVSVRMADSFVPWLIRRAKTAFDGCKSELDAITSTPAKCAAYPIPHAKGSFAVAGKTDIVSIVRTAELPSPLGADIFSSTTGYVQLESPGVHGLYVRGRAAVVRKFALAGKPVQEPMLEAMIHIAATRAQYVMYAFFRALMGPGHYSFECSMDWQERIVGEMMARSLAVSSSSLSSSGTVDGSTPRVIIHKTMSHEWVPVHIAARPPMSFEAKCAQVGYESLL